MAEAGILRDCARIWVPAISISRQEISDETRAGVEQELVRLLRAAGVELVVLAGFMRVLKAPMLEAFARRIVNMHPSLLPKFPGREAWTQALGGG